MLFAKGLGTLHLVNELDFGAVNEHQFDDTAESSMQENGPLTRLDLQQHQTSHWEFCVWTSFWKYYSSSSVVWKFPRQHSIENIWSPWKTMYIWLLTAFKNMVSTVIDMRVLLFWRRGMSLSSTTNSLTIFNLDAEISTINPILSRLPSHFEHVLYVIPHNIQIPVLSSCFNVIIDISAFRPDIIKQFVAESAVLWNDRYLYYIKNVFLKR